MKTLTKTGIVIAGYACALAIGVAAVYARFKAMKHLPKAQAALGTYAFADFMTFLFVLRIASLVPSGLAYYFLCENSRFWTEVGGIAHRNAPLDLSLSDRTLGKPVQAGRGERPSR
jgi:hypothetical protein